MVKHSKLRSYLPDVLPDVLPDINPPTEWGSLLGSNFQLKESGKGLSTNDYTTEEKQKLAGISPGGGYVHPTTHPPGIIEQDSQNRFVTDTEKTAWNGKEPGNSNIQIHVSSVHAPSNAQANADIIKSEIEAKLTGEISSHSHAGGGGGLSQQQIEGLI